MGSTYADDEDKAVVVGVAVGLLWLAAAAILGLAALVSTVVSNWLFVPFSIWAVTAFALGFWLPGASGARPHRVAAVIGAGSCAVAVALALITPGSEMMWAVVLFCGLATLYSVLLTRRA